MNRVYNKVRELSRNGQLMRALSYKCLAETGASRFWSFKVRDIQLRLFKSEMTYEAWKCPSSYRLADEVFLKRVLKPGGMVVDVGANIGMIAMQAAKLVGPSGRVIAIEPNPRILAYCEGNIRLNHLKNVTVFQTALGDQVGNVSFHCDRADDCSRVISEGGITVPITTLDKLMGNEPEDKIDLLKIDVEGFELSVLAGAQQTLRKTRWLYIEVDAGNYSHYGKTVDGVTALLDANGFDTFVSDDQGNWQEMKGRITESVNLIGRNRNN